MISKGEKGKGEGDYFYLLSLLIERATVGEGAGVVGGSGSWKVCSWPD